jgi:ABC-2 type transport system ATP-binding protein
MVSVREVSKSYGKVLALSGVSLDAEAGEIFGLIGPDGAGKTTLFRIMTTLILADSGTATVDGLDVVRDYRAIRDRVGYMPGRFSLYQDLTVEENLDFFATVFDTSIDENYDLVKDIYGQIEPFKKRRAGALSGGMKQKLALSCALIHRPRVLFLDEPTTGVDPVSRREFWEMLARLKGEGIAILVSTPYMDEAARCDRIALVQGGAFLRIDTPRGIVERYEKRLWAVRGGGRISSLLDALRSHEGVESCFAFGDTLHVVPRDASLSPEGLAAWLALRGHGDVRIEPIRAGIEDCFMDLAAVRESLA